MTKKPPSKTAKLFGCVTPELLPAHHEFIHHCEESCPRYLILCDALSIPSFSDVLRDELRSFFAPDRIQLIESLIRLHDFGNAGEMRTQRDLLRDELNACIKAGASGQL